MSAALEVKYTDEGIAIAKEKWLDELTDRSERAKHLEAQKYAQTIAEIAERYAKRAAEIAAQVHASHMAALALTPWEQVHAQVAASVASSELERTFAALVEQWRSETMHLSSTTEKAMNFAYQQIIGMGKDALPLIFRELQQRGGHWFWALSAITRENPVRPEDRGNVRRMAQVWLEWGRQNGYLQG